MESMIDYVIENNKELANLENLIYNILESIGNRRKKWEIEQVDY